MKNILLNSLYLLPPFAPVVVLFSPRLGISLRSDAGLTLLLSAWVLSVVALILYIRHIRTNDRVNKENKALWVLLVLLGGPIGEVVYWYKYIRTSLA